MSQNTHTHTHTHTLCLKPSEYFKCYSQLFLELYDNRNYAIKSGSRKKPLLKQWLTMTMSLEMLSSHHCYDVYRVSTMATGERSWDFCLADMGNTGLWSKQMMGSPIHQTVFPDIVPWAQSLPSYLLQPRILTSVCFFSSCFHKIIPYITHSPPFNADCMETGGERLNTGWRRVSL